MTYQDQNSESQQDYFGKGEHPSKEGTQCFQKNKGGVSYQDQNSESQQDYFGR